MKKTIVWFGFIKDSVRNPQIVIAHFVEEFELVCGQAIIKETKEELK